MDAAHGVAAVVDARPRSHFCERVVDRALPCWPQPAHGITHARFSAMDRIQQECLAAERTRPIHMASADQQMCVVISIIATARRQVDRTVDGDTVAR